MLRSCYNERVFYNKGDRFIWNDINVIVWSLVLNKDDFMIKKLVS